MVQKLAEEGLKLLETGMMNHIEDSIFELRPSIYRLFCYLDQGDQSFILLNGFLKNTQRTPDSQKSLARALIADYLAGRRG